MTVVANNTRVRGDVFSNTGISSIGGGAGAESTDNPAAFSYQGVGIIYRKVTSATGAGFQYEDAGTFDMTAAATRTFMAKVNVTDFGGLQATNGLRLRLGSGSGAYYDYIVAGSNAKIASLAEYPAKGGFIILPIDPNIAGYRDSTTGAPALASGDYFALVGAFSSASAKAENIGLDAMDLGTGLTLDGTAVALIDFVDFDEGTKLNRFGYAFLLADGVFGAFGTWTIGSATATTMTDSARETIVFPDGLFAAGWSGLAFDLQNASTALTIENKTFSSLGSISVEDSRAIMGVTGTSGDLTLNDCGFINFESMILNSKTALNRNAIINVESVTLAAALIDESTIAGSPVASNIASFITTNDVDNITNCPITSGGTGHFAEIQTAGTYNWDGNTLSGYGGTPGSNLVAASGDPDAALYNNSGGAVTITVINGASVPSIRNGAGATTTVISALEYELTGLDAGASVTIVDITVPATPVELFNEVAGVDGIVTYSFDGALSGTAIGVYLLNTIIKINEFDDVLPSVNVSFPVNQTADNVYIP